MRKSASMLVLPTAMLALGTAFPSSATLLPVSGSGMAATVESQGLRAGCVAWSFQAEPKPSGRYVNQVKLVFTFVNHCAYPVEVALAYQTHNGPGEARYGPSLALKPGEVYEGQSRRGNYLFFDVDTDKWLRFWVHESERPFDEVRLDLRRCNAKYPSPARHPSCPPAHALFDGVLPSVMTGEKP